MYQQKQSAATPGGTLASWGGVRAQWDAGRDAQGAWGGIGVALSDAGKTFEGAPVSFTRRTG